MITRPGHTQENHTTFVGNNTNYRILNYYKISFWSVYHFRVEIKFILKHQKNFLSYFKMN